MTPPLDNLTRAAPLDGRAWVSRRVHRIADTDLRILREGHRCEHLPSGGFFRGAAFAAPAALVLWGLVVVAAAAALRMLFG